MNVTNLIKSYYNTYTQDECDFIGYCNTNRIKIDWKNFKTFFKINFDVWKKEVSLQSTIKNK